MADESELFLLREEPDVAVVAPEHPMAKKKVFPVKKMGEYPFIGATGNEMQLFFDMLQKEGVTLDHEMVVNSDYGCFSMISKNLGFGVYPKMVVSNCVLVFMCGATICGLSSFKGGFALLLIGRVIQASRDTSRCCCALLSSVLSPRSLHIFITDRQGVPDVLYLYPYRCRASTSERNEHKSTQQQIAILVLEQGYEQSVL